ncbi:baseplate multidomain protein megatron [Mesobacterium pallidum]|uniref:baseplate multidomain protein megatron n=1 Tax=Mesobacterium pallidum TaxID=2872037 RepID=UPI001EE2511F|nr:glycoside hydrolase TIM-barrel-like domain-containing protein [Mesobacterium pallidum]
MATIILSAAGAAIGSSFGGTLLGLSATAVGRFVGASLGRVIDQRLMGQGSEVVETGRVDRLRLTSVGEGEAIAQAHGRVRIGGQVIWSSAFREKVSTKKSGGSGKGTSQPKVTTKTYTYSVSLAVALCEGEITHISRIWADGEELAPEDLNMRVYPGDQAQMPDPKIEAVEGAGMVPAYRGTAYVVFEDLQLERFGNRVPQFSFEVTRPVPAEQAGAADEVAHGVQGVALMPGTGEYSLATSKVFYDFGQGKKSAANVNQPQGVTDFTASMAQLQGELPNCGAASLIVSWFGSDLRCGLCEMRPKVEQAEFDGAGMPWTVSGLTRAQAQEVVEVDGRAAYGGTPADAAVVEAIRDMADRGIAVMFYPFLLMEQVPENGLTDPWSGADDQPVLPWRGRITLSVAPGRDGSPDGTAAADGEVTAFFGTASANDFTVGDGVVTYSGPNEWSYRRFILHNAALCAAAGGVDSFCIGSEMRSLTQIRGAGDVFVAVQHLKALAVEARALLGPEVKIGYAADWSEYFGYIPEGTGDRYFHLDPLWMDDEIDFIGIDNYMPLSDWRDGDDHLDAENGWRSIYDLDYLRSNIEGGEGYDWYYAHDQASDAQIRTPISDGAHDEPWIWRYKDIRAWWSNLHFERVDGVRADLPTAWEPQKKPIWFTEIGCAAIDKGTNQPNKFLDPKSSESKLPKYSNGRRDELMQAQYLRAMFSYWTDPANNPQSEEYAGQMLDMSRCFVWAWDARPYPWFPGNRDLWDDGDNYSRGHWLNGRTSGRPLDSLVAEICDRAGLASYDTSRLFGYVRGYTFDQVGEARAALQPLMLRYGFDAVERDGTLAFLTRDGLFPTVIDETEVARSKELDGTVERSRGAALELSGRVRLRFVQADGDYDVVAEEAVLPQVETHAVSQSEVPLVMTRAEGRETVERWLAEARLARDSARIALPPSMLRVGPGDVLQLGAESDLYRVDSVEQGPSQIVEAVRIEPSIYQASTYPDDGVSLTAFAAPVPVVPFFLDLPLLTGEEVPHAPHLAVTADPWPGSVALFDSVIDSDYALNAILGAQARIGVTETPLAFASHGLVDRGTALQVKMLSGEVESITDAQLLAGGNLLAIGDGSAEGWELIQFRDAALIAEDTWLLSHRLRGQLGTDAFMPEVWPAGSWVIALDGIPEQIDLGLATRDLARHFRLGPASRSVDDPTYVHLVQAFKGNGLRPYRPSHLRLVQDAAGTVQMSWVRRTRIGGDSWESPEVPLNEEAERYMIRVLIGGQVFREHTQSGTSWSYSQADAANDGAFGNVEFQVAQVSAIYGPGPFASGFLSI